MKLNWKNTRLMVVGDAMIDRYIWGEIERISPEAPVPVLDWRFDEDRLGGAANVALNARALDIPVALCAVIGQDENGKLLQQLCSKEGINNDYVYASPFRPTSVKTRILAGQQHLLRVDREEKSLITNDEIESLKILLTEALNQFQPTTLILQDYNKGLLHPDLIKWLIQQCQQKQIFVAVDPKKDQILHYQNIQLFKPNLKELSQLMQRKIHPEQKDLDMATKELRKQLKFDQIMVTLSQHGIYYEDQNGSSGIAPTQARSIVDVCGAGDAVITLAAIALQNGLSLEETAQLCNIAGGQVCESVGVSTLNKSNIEKEWSETMH